MLDSLAKVAEELGLPFESVSLDRLGAEADVIVTITSSFGPILMDAQVKPGMHIACMGTDTKGKQEVEAALVARASVFTDEVTQAVSMGECQHAVAAGQLAEGDIGEIGAVINGDNPGRRSDSEVTLFDGTGVGLQDLRCCLGGRRSLRWRRAWRSRSTSDGAPGRHHDQRVRADRAG